MITTAQLITIAKAAKASSGEINPTCRVFVARLLGEIRTTEGQAAHNELARALGMDHMVGNAPSKWEHLRALPERLPLIQRAEDWKTQAVAALAAPKN